MTCNNNFFKLSSIKTVDRELIRTYAIGVIMFSLLDEYSKAERMGAIAKIFNALAKKHNAFHHQLMQLNISKRKKISYKCELFLKAKRFAECAWAKTIDSRTDKNAITINATVGLLRFKNSAAMARIYGLKQEVFSRLNSSEQPENTIFSSIRTANALLKHLDECISNADKRGGHGAA